MMPKAKTQESQPILDALSQLQRRLEVPFSVSLIVGTASRRELMARSLPGHVRVIAKKRQGPRVPVRQRRHHYESKQHTAKWPNDHMIEGTTPLLACVIAGEADFQIADYALCCQVGDCVLFPVGVPRQDGVLPFLEW